MALKHAFSSAAAASADATKIDGPKWNADHVVDSGGMTMDTATGTPATPAAGQMKLFSREVGGRNMPAFVGASGLSSSLQPHVGRNRILAWSPNGVASGISVFGGNSTVGSPSGRSINGLSLFTSMRRAGYATAATANSNASARGGGLNYVMSNVAKVGGFHNIWRFGVQTYHAEARMFVGLGAGNSSYGAISPSSISNSSFIGVGFDAGDTSWSVYHADSVGTPTKIPLGAGFPCNTNETDVYDFAVFVAPGSLEIKYTMTRLNDETSISGTITTEVPNQTLQPHLSVTNGASATVCALDLMSMYIETDY